MTEEIRHADEIIRRVWPEWTVVSRLGSGSYSNVYKVVRRGYGGEQEQAVKVIRVPRDRAEWEEQVRISSEQEAVRHFREIALQYTHEIRLMYAVSSCPNIVTIHDHQALFAEDEKAWYIFIRMELVSRLNIKAMQEPDVIRLGIQICEALKVCARKNIVHRDIKESNIFINENGDYKLGDFGVARTLDHATKAFTSIGTPLYMAPEVYTHSLSETDPERASRADIYSLGVLLYYLCNHLRFPFEPQGDLTRWDREQALQERSRNDRYPLPVNAHPGLARVIMKACRRKPEDRYGSAEEMQQDLAAIDGQLRQIRPFAPQPGYAEEETVPIPKPPGKHAPTPNPMGKHAPAPPPDRKPPRSRTAKSIGAILAGAAVIVCAVLLLTRPQTGGAPPAERKEISAETLMTEAPTAVPTEAPTAVPTEAPTGIPTEAPAAVPTEAPTDIPTEAPTAVPTEEPTDIPTEAPESVPAAAPVTAEPAGADGSFTDQPAGDVNGDGHTDVKDLVRLMKYLLSRESTAVTGNSDLNDDGVTDLKDLIRLEKLILNP